MEKYNMFQATSSVLYRYQMASPLFWLIFDRKFTRHLTRQALFEGHLAGPNSFSKAF